MPPFVVEVKSPSDSEKELQAKCRQWIANGAELVRFINGEDRTVWEYFGATERLLENAKTLYGKDSVQGFVLDLSPI